VVTKLAGMNATTARLTAEERREEVIAAATREFGARGFAGTSTQAIAERVGVSQPYLFQLFGTKKDLFIAVVQACFTRTRSAFETSARAARKSSDDPIEILDAMGHTYISLLRDRDMLRLQLQAYAACEDPDIQAVVRQEWTDLYEAVARVSGADEPALHAWFAEGMLLNVAASIGDLDSAVALKLTHRGAHAKH
jgi:AcrR family transcriptional regulator